MKSDRVRLSDVSAGNCWAFKTTKTKISLDGVFHGINSDYETIFHRRLTLGGQFQVFRSVLYIGSKLLASPGENCQWWTIRNSLWCYLLVSTPPIVGSLISRLCVNMRKQVELVELDLKPCLEPEKMSWREATHKTVEKYHRRDTSGTTWLVVLKMISSTRNYFGP